VTATEFVVAELNSESILDEYGFQGGAVALQLIGITNQGLRIGFSGVLVLSVSR
jgi:hypothetical protein